VSVSRHSTTDASHAHNASGRALRTPSGVGSPGQLVSVLGAVARELAVRWQATDAELRRDLNHRRSYTQIQPKDVAAAERSPTGERRDSCGADPATTPGVPRFSRDSAAHARSETAGITANRASPRSDQTADAPGSKVGRSSVSFGIHLRTPAVAEAVLRGVEPEGRCDWHLGCSRAFRSHRAYTNVVGDRCFVNCPGGDAASECHHVKHRNCRQVELRTGRSPDRAASTGGGLSRIDVHGARTVRPDSLAGFDRLPLDGLDQLDA